MKYNSRELEKGEKIRLLAGDSFVTAKYCEDIRITIKIEGEPIISRMNPKFELEDGCYVYGYECYWIPEKEALERIKKLRRKK